MHHHVILSNRCQNNCIMCATGGHSHTLQSEDVIGSLNIHHGDNVLLTGGEPSFHKDFIEIAKYIKEQGGIVEILTNSIKFADPKFCNEATQYIDSAQCSIYSWSENINNYITRNKKAYKKTQVGIHNLIDDSVDVSIKTIANIRPCYRTIDLTVEYIINEFNHDNIWLSGCDFVGNAQKNFNVIIPLMDCGWYIDKAVELAASRGFMVHLMYLPLCTLSNRNLNLVKSHPGGSTIDTYLSDGDPEYCNAYDYNYLESCGRCALKPKCTGVWSKYLKYFNGDQI